MKRNLFVWVLAMTAMFAEAQGVTLITDDDRKQGEFIDRVKYEIVYDMNSVVNPKAGERASFNEQMLLQIGDKCSAFYSYASYQVDSLIAEQMRKGEDININTSSQVSWKVYRNYPAMGRSAYLDRIANDRYVVEEELDVPRWEIVADSTRQILGYTAHLATAKYRGRVWNAWYAADIPLGDGPWKLHGLPGLILSAYDSNREFTFNAVGIRNVREEKMMEYKGRDYEPIARKSLNKIYKRYYSDAIGYTLMSYPSSSNRTITITDENGNALKHSAPQDYNLIEW